MIDTIGMKNKDKLNPCSGCGLLTWNGKNALCNVCRENLEKNEPNNQNKEDEIYNSNDEEFYKLLIADLPDLPVGRQITKLSSCIGKQIRKIEIINEFCLRISFTTNSYIEFNIAHGEFGEILQIKPVSSKKERKLHRNQHLNELKKYLPVGKR